MAALRGCRGILRAQSPGVVAGPSQAVSHVRSPSRQLASLPGPAALRGDHSSSIHRQHRSTPGFKWGKWAAQSVLRRGLFLHHGRSPLHTSLHVPSPSVDSAGGDPDPTLVASWEDAYREAEEIVGPMNTLAGTRNLLGEELASVGVYAQRLFESGHPIIHKTKGLIFDVNNSRQLRGLTILLLSKVINTGGHTGSISSKQRALAEITELILAANLLHDGVIELEPCRPPSDPDASVGSIEGTHLVEADRLDKGLRFGNKIAILGGDFLLASACTSLARLHNAKAVMLVSSGISSCTEGLALTTAHSAAAASGAVLTLTEWRHSAELVSATLFSHCCEAAACLHDHSPNVQAAAAEFGTRFAVAYQLKSEVDLWYHGQLGLSPAVVALRSSPVVMAAAAAVESGAPPLALDLVRRSADTRGSLTEAELTALAAFVDQHDGMGRALAECRRAMAASMIALDVLPDSPARRALNKLTRTLAEPKAM